jgi:hypothetical protein
MVLRTHCAPRRNIMTRIEPEGCQTACRRATPARDYGEAIPHDGGRGRNLAEVSALTYVLGDELVSAAISTCAKPATTAQGGETA